MFGVRLGCLGIIAAAFGPNFEDDAFVIDLSNYFPKIERISKMISNKLNVWEKM